GSGGVILWPSPAGWSWLGMKPKGGRGAGPWHNYATFRLARLLHRNGCTVHLEKDVAGKPVDLLTTATPALLALVHAPEFQPSADAVIAFEIETDVTETGLHNMTADVERGLWVVLGVQRHQLAKAASMRDQLDPAHQERIAIIDILDLINPPTEEPE